MKRWNEAIVLAVIGSGAVCWWSWDRWSPRPPLYSLEDEVAQTPPAPALSPPPLQPVVLPSGPSQLLPPLAAVSAVSAEQNMSPLGCVPSVALAAFESQSRVTEAEIARALILPTTVSPEEEAELPGPAPVDTRTDLTQVLEQLAGITRPVERACGTSNPAVPATGPTPAVASLAGTTVPAPPSAALHQPPNAPAAQNQLRGDANASPALRTPRTIATARLESDVPRAATPTVVPVAPIVLQPTAGRFQR